MKQLVFIENGRPVTDSLTVAEVFGKEHKHVIRDIEVQLEKLAEAGEKEWGVSNFGLTQYQHPQNKQRYPKYNLTEDAFTLLAMSYVTPEAMKMKVKFIQEFKQMRDQLQKQVASNVVPLDERKVRMELLKTAIDHEERLETVEKRIVEIEQKVDEQITLDHGEQRALQKAVARRIYELESNTQYRRELFRQLHREIKDRWAVASYRDVRRNELQQVLKYIDGWMPRRVS